MINFRKAPPPEVIETLEFQAILTELEESMLELWPEWEGRGILSDPIQRQQISCAYRELLLRARINDAAKAVMLTWSTSSDLDELGLLYGVHRLVLEQGDSKSSPVKLPVMESDADFLARIQLAPEAFNTAGGAGAYQFLALTAGEKPKSLHIEKPEGGRVIVTYTFDSSALSSGIKDVSVAVPEPGTVVLTVLSREGEGIPSQMVLDAVAAATSGDDVRPIADYVQVVPAEIVKYIVRAEGYSAQRPPQKEMDRAIKAANEYVKLAHRLKGVISRSALSRELHLPGVFSRVRILEPVDDLICSKSQAPLCDAVDFVWVEE